MGLLAWLVRLELNQGIPGATALFWGVDRSDGLASKACEGTPRILIKPGDSWRCAALSILIETQQGIVNSRHLLQSKTLQNGNASPFGLPTWPWVKIQIVPQVNIPIPTKIGSEMGGEFTYQPKWDRSQNAFDNHSLTKGPKVPGHRQAQTPPGPRLAGSRSSARRQAKSPSFTRLSL